MKIEQVKVAELKPYQKNARTHPESQIKQIARSIEEFGFNNPILATKEGRIIAGHGRVEAAKVLNLDTVPVVRIEHLSPEQIQAYTLADNQLALTSKWDADALAEEIKELYGVGFDLDLLGFDPSELAAMLEVKPEIDESLLDEVPEVEEVAITKAGDLWQLGDHRLLCGDSTKAEDVARLMSGVEIDLVFTSPPYGLGDSIKLSNNKIMSKKGNAYVGHKDDPNTWAELMKKWIQVIFDLEPECVITNVQLLANNKRDLIEWISEKKDRLIDIITWDKGHAAPQIARGVCASRHEWLIAFGKSNASRAFPLSSWQGTMQNVYVGPPQRNNEFFEKHAATMPMHLPLWVIGELCNLAKTVLDPFAGTGTTIIACEQLARTGFGIEISPQYCDVIIKRWQKLTGKRALNLNTGDYFGGTTE
jgi:DNA modification methylase